MPDIRDLLDSAAPTRTTAPDLETITRRARRRTVTRRSTAALAALVLLAGSFTLAQRLRPEPTVVLEQLPSPQASASEVAPLEPEPATPVEGVSAPLEPAPIPGHGYAEAHWTGEDLLVWTGGDIEDVASYGALWNSQAGWWPIPAKDSGRYGQGMAFSKTSLFLAGGTTLAEGDAEAVFGMPLAAYDFRSASWTDLPPAPLSARDSPVTVWTGDELLVWGGGHGYEGEGPRQDGALYDPRTQEWRPMAPAPLDEGMAAYVSVWTGRQVVVGAGDNSLERYDFEQWASYDVASDTWELLPAPPVRILAMAGIEPDTQMAHGVTQMVWTGDEVLVLHSQDTGNVTSLAALRLDGSGWRVLPDAPVFSGITPVGREPELVWAGDRLIVLAQPHPHRPDLPTAAAYSPATGIWTPLPDAPNHPSQAAAWDGRSVLSWSGYDETGTLRNDGVIYTPTPSG